MLDFDYIVYDYGKKDQTRATELFNVDIARRAMKFHRDIPGYRMTRLVALPHLASMLGIGGIYIKDEAQRLELNSFKVLGGSYAISRFIQKKLGLSDDETTYDYLASEECHKRLGNITFAAATDGNHGRGIAWAAMKLNHKCVIYVHKETSKARIEAIRSYGAEVNVVDGNYDDAVRLIAEDAKKYGWTIISDTSWDGYTEIPTWIMQGYGTLALEAFEQLQQAGVAEPTHIFVQAGVGSFAGAVQGFFTNVCKDNPSTVVVEAGAADCLYKSAVAKDGNPHAVGGDLSTIMAGLACGEANTIGWDVLRDNSTMFVSCPDWVAANGMRILGNPLGNDTKVVSGESGAVPTGLFVELMTNPQLEDMRKALKLDENSQVLIFSTEGDTDPDMYRDIVWNGKFAKK